MANEFTARNGIIAKNNSVITGSLIVTQGITGSLFGTSSRAVSSSFAATAATATSAPLYLPLAGGFLSGDLTATNRTFQINQLTVGNGSTAGNIKTDAAKPIGLWPGSTVESARFLSNGNTILGTTFVNTGSYRLQVSASAVGAIEAIGNSVITGSLIVTQGITGSLFGTASFATSASQAQTASYVLNAVSASFSTLAQTSNTASYVVTAQTASYVLQAVSASLATLSQTANTASYVVTAQTASFVATAQTASYVLNALSASRATSAANADTASYILNAVSSSYALSSSFAISSSLAQTASFVTLAQTASYILNAVSASRSISSANADTASFVTLAQTASYVQNAISASYIVTAQTASYVLNAVSSSFATSASYALKAVSASIATSATSAVTSDTASKADQVKVIDNVNSLLYFPLIASSSAGYQQVTTVSGISYDADNAILVGTFQGNLEGTANVAYQAQTASYVNTLNQNVLISGSLTVGSGSIGPNENTLTLGARDAASEGGQIGFNAPGGTYTSASFIDLYQNRLRILKGTNSTSTGEVANWSMHNLQMALPAYNSVGAFSGTVAGLLAFDSSGNIITAATSSGGGSTSPGGSNTQIQYNNGSAFGGVSTLIFDGTTLRATGSFTGSLTGELVGTASWASNAVTASYAMNAGGGGAAFPYTGDASISGSLTVTGSASTQVPLRILSGSTSLLYVSSSGNVGISNSAPTSRLQLNFNQNSTAQNDNNGILLANSTAATVGLQSISPGLVWQGNGWKTTATAGSQDVRFRADVLPVQGTTSPSATWTLASSINGAAYVNRYQASSAGSHIFYDNNGAVLINIANNGTITMGGGQISNLYSISAILQLKSGAATATVAYRTTNAGSDVTPTAFFGAPETNAAGTLAYATDITNGLSFTAANGTRHIARANIQMSASNNTAGSEAGDLLFLTQTGGTAMSEKMRITGAGNVNISGSLTVTGSNSTQYILQILSGSTSLLAVSGSGGSVGIGGAPSSYKLYVNGGAAGLLGLNVNGASTFTGLINSNSTISAGDGSLSSILYKTSNTGSSTTARLAAYTTNFTVVGNKLFSWDATNQLVFSVANNTNSTAIARASIQVSASNNASGSEAGDLLFLTQTGGTDMTEKMRIFGGGNVAIGTSTNSGYKLDVSGTARVSGNVSIEGGGGISIAGNSSANRLTLGPTSTYKATNAGGNLTPIVSFYPQGVAGSVSAGLLGFSFDDGDTTGLSFVAGNGTNFVARANIQMSASNNTAGSEAGDLLFLTQTGGTAASEKMRITGAGGITYTATNTAAGTTGAQTINKPSGTVNIATAGTTVTVTNSLVTANSIVFATIRTNDSTAVIKNVVPTAGSFTINLNAATTAETSIGFFVIN